MTLMPSITHLGRHFLPALLLVCLAVTLPVGPASGQTVTGSAQEDTATVTAGGISFRQLEEVDGWVLSVSGPNDFYFRKEFTGDTPSVSFSEMGKLRDGVYGFELRPVIVVGSGIYRQLQAARDSGDSQATAEIRATLLESGGLPADVRVHSGGFSVVAGRVVAGGNSAEYSMPREQSTRDQVFLDDVIIDGSLCVGLDCVNGESFGFDTLRLKENNLRIHFQDTSTSASFPSNDWRIVINQSANGGMSFFRIEDASSGRKPFTIQAGARDHALYVDPQGDVGIGTNSPATDIHAVVGNTPTLRLDQDGSSGFTPQTWDIAGNETNFFVRDVTNGSRLVFRIRPGAPTDSLHIKDTGRVGMGTAAPVVRLHLQGANDALAGASDIALRVTNTSTTTGSRQMARFENNGDSKIGFKDTNSGNQWNLGSHAFGAKVVITKSGSAGHEMVIDGATGDMTIRGTLTQGSSRSIKSLFAPVSSGYVLSQVVALPIYEWSYSSDEENTRHLGPVAEDFAAAFGLGVDDKHIAPGDTAGVALAAIKGLYELLETQQQQIAGYEARIQDLEARIAELSEQR
jgi:hypothetical protein